MTWLNRGFKIRHKFIKEKEMKEQAIRALELFKQQHLAKAVDEVPTNGQADIVSESPDRPNKGNLLNDHKETFTEIQARWAEEARQSDAPEENKKSINYPDHIKPLSERMLTALKNGARTVDTVAKYCKEGEKLVRLQLNLMVSRGKIGRQTNPQSQITRYYPADIAKEMGILTAPQPINRKPKKTEEKKRSSSVTAKLSDDKQILHVRIDDGKQPTQAKEAKYIEFLEKRIVEWQVECRKLANENEKIKDALGKSLERRNVTGEVQEVMKEVMELRATISYLESKLFGRK